jgi:acetoin utilization deacetylase AcuC-like enzyme
MGFCLFANVAVAARWAQVNLLAERVAILDWDVHHGNGTQDIFWSDPSVLFVSLHQWPFWPGTGGPGEGNETTANVPLEAGSGDDEYLKAFDETVEPAIRAFGPELLLVSAGFDAGAGDLIGGMRVTEEGFAEMARRAKGLCGRVALVLEGGYTLETLPGFVGAVADVF